ncbi:MAG: UDP-N-acetylmuramoyl-tripeptide--D-alanyl-D-alanine ligase [Bacteroidota bacterium]
MEKEYQIESLYAKFLQSNGVVTDTRKLQSGDLFFALRGPNFNGNAYAAAALDAGASCAVIDDPAYAVEGKTMLVADTLAMLQDLARFHRSRLRCPVLGITGSNGKTTTKELVRNVLAKRFVVASTSGNLNNHIGVPLTVLEINPQAEFAIVEMGASAVGDIALLCSIAMPTMGLITNIGKAHTETFGGIEGVIRGKSELFDYLRKNSGQVFINSLDRVLYNMTKRFESPVIYPMEDMAFSGADPFIIYQSTAGQIETSLIGAYNYANIAAAVAVGRYMKVAEELIHQAIATYAPDNNRSELAVTGSNTLVKDAYNANPDSMKAAVENFVAMTGRKVAILGDMNELDHPVSEHQQMGQWIGSLGLDQVIFCGPLMKAAHAACAGSLYFDEVGQVAKWLEENMPTNAKILLKGSRGIRLERLFPILEKE